MLKASSIKITITIVTLLLVIVSFNNYFFEEALSTIKSAITKLSESSKFVFIIKKGISYFTSSSIPMIEGYAKVSITDLGKVSSYLTISQVLLKIQLLLLKISNLTFFKLLPILFCVGLFFNSSKVIALKLVLVSLLLCPGLSIFTNGIHKVVNSINKVSIGVDLHQKLKETKETFQEKEATLKTHQEQIRESQLEKAKSRGKDHISFFKRAEDAVVNVVENTSVKIEKDVKLIEQVLLINTESLFLKLIKMIGTLILLVIILPLFYFYAVNIVIKDLFQFNISQTIHSLLEKGPVK